MKNRIITISREFGSGGRTIGKEVAKKLGISCYDEELIKKYLKKVVLQKIILKNKVNILLEETGLKVFY